MKKLVLTIASVFLLAGCNDKTSGFIGEWISSKDSEHKVIITKAGNSEVTLKEDHGFIATNKNYQVSDNKLLDLGKSVAFELKGSDNLIEIGVYNEETVFNKVK